MTHRIGRRLFLESTLAGAAAVMGGAYSSAFAATGGLNIISPGAVKSKARVGLLYLGKPAAHWPTPSLNIEDEIGSYQRHFADSAAFHDIDFVGGALASSAADAEAAAANLGDIDGLLLVHVSMGISDALNAALKLGKPTVLFAAPYSGHEWSHFGRLMQTPEGALLDCILSSDRAQLAEAVRPFRAIHHLREAKILNVTARDLNAEYCGAIKEKFGTEIVRVGRDDVLAAYNAVNDADAERVAKDVINQAARVVEPSRDEIVRSCKLALAFERMLAEAEATTITVDCYGTMYRQLPAFPCIGFTRLNDMGLAGICESDLASAMTFILMQSLSGRPGFISDPTVDESKNSIILAHCLGSTRMDGPGGPACPYKIRTIMERQEGAVMQVTMRKEQRVTQAILTGTDRLLYFTGVILDAPETERGCRTKIDVRVDGDVQTLWRNWQAGLHRVTCYGGLAKDLERFCRFKSIKLEDEARQRA